MEKRATTLFGRELQDYMEFEAIGRAPLAEKLNVSYGTIQRWLDGSNGLRNNFLDAMELLNIPLNRFDRYFKLDKGVDIYSQIPVEPSRTQSQSPKPEAKPKAIGKRMALECIVKDGKLMIGFDNEGFTLVEILGLLDVKADEIRKQIWQQSDKIESLTGGPKGK